MSLMQQSDLMESSFKIDFFFFCKSLHKDYLELHIDFKLETNGSPTVVKSEIKNRSMKMKNSGITRVIHAYI